jgi:hypothetical protein
VSVRAGAITLTLFFFALTLTLAPTFSAIFKSGPVMFDFKKLDVYKKEKLFNAGLREFIKHTRLGSSTKDQLRRASFSVVLNLAERSGRFTHPDRRNFYIIAGVPFLNVLQSWIY